jgi:hypothetical protein
MQANASEGAKVLPIARTSIRNTGMLRTMAEASGKSTKGLQPPRRLRSHDRDGAYASEKRSAERISEVTVALLRSRPVPFTNENVAKISNNANNQEQREIESNFMCDLWERRVLPIADCRLPIEKTHSLSMAVQSAIGNRKSATPYARKINLTTYPSHVG